MAGSKLPAKGAVLEGGEERVVQVGPFGTEEIKTGVWHDHSLGKPLEQLLAQTNESFITATPQADLFGDGLVEC